jgi:lactoylglutathione lyase
MKEITRINHVGLRVKNLDVTRSFYEKLGFLFLVGPDGNVIEFSQPAGL